MARKKTKDKQAVIGFRTNPKKAEDMEIMASELGLKNKSEFLDRATDTFMYTLDLGLKKQMEMKLQMLENKQSRRLQSLDERYELEKQQIIADTQADIDFIKQSLKENAKETAVAPNKDLLSEEELVDDVYKDLLRLYRSSEFDGQNVPVFYVEMLNRRLKLGTEYCQRVIKHTIENNEFFQLRFKCCKYIHCIIVLE